MWSHMWNLKQTHRCRVECYLPGGGDKEKWGNVGQRVQSFHYAEKVISGDLDTVRWL